MLDRLTALLAALTILLYTTAATALVQPQLRFTNSQHRMLQCMARFAMTLFSSKVLTQTAQVYSSFANSYYVQQTCRSPISHLIDNETDIGTSCIQIEHASQAYHNHQSWLSSWTDVALVGNGTRDLKTRTPGWALLNDNTTITAPWIETNATDQTAWYLKTGWIVNNVTMAMPHPGVVAAAIDPINSIMQPDELDGLGSYSVRASVPVPFVNVMCVTNMAEADLNPVMNETAGYTTDGTDTPLDDIFHWGPRWGSHRWPPRFSKLPAKHNSVMNNTSNMPYGRKALYVLGRGGEWDQAGALTSTNYALCSIQVGQTPHCSTQYNASSHGGTLEAICEDPYDELRYSVSDPSAPSGNASLSSEWPNVGSEWANAICLNDGSVDANSSNVRIWTQLFLSANSLDEHGHPVLSSAMPSPAEALAVLSGCTLLSSTTDTPFVEFWNYSSPILSEPGQTQYFNASIRAQQYASGGTEGYQKGFLVVLLAAFILNATVLGYFVNHRYWYLDFADQFNLFPLAVNSPPSRQSVESTCEIDGEEMHFKQV